MKKRLMMGFYWVVMPLIAVIPYPKGTNDKKLTKGY